MYELRPEIKVLQVDRENIVAIIESINSPFVAAGDRPSESAKAYIVGVRNPSGLFAVYIYLYLKGSNDCLVFLHDPPEVQMAAYHETEVEALGFVESMGFMVDNLNFRNLSPDHQKDLMRTMPVFWSDLSAYARSQDSDVIANISESTGELDLSPLEGDVLELDELAEVIEKVAVAAAPILPPEGLAKIARLYSTF